MNAVHVQSDSATTATHSFVLTSDTQRGQFTLSTANVQAGVDLITIRWTADAPVTPPVLTLRWIHPACDIHASWHPAQDRNKSFKADWMRVLRSNAATSAPVYSLFNAESRNRLTFAFSDALNTVLYAGGVREETAEFHCRIELFKEPVAPIAEYEATLLVDTRDVPYYVSLRGVSDWWSGMERYTPSYVPDEARRPMYSTWYNMHQNVTAASIEAECRRAKELGMDAVIIDDGWQTGDNRRGYAYTGDWEPFGGKFPRMREHVDAIHALGMKVILWYSVPFVGKHSEAWTQYSDKLLRFNESHGAGTMDPRYPEVREYIIGKYEQAVREWDLDGFKLDFIDQFYTPELATPSELPGRDIESIPEAVDVLLTESIRRLRAVKPDVMVEFRQPYIGPAMRKYGNMFRASDCPNDSIQNRVRTLDIRLICGATAAHADMIMWHPDEPVESAALQLLGLLFSVPQVSVTLEKLPEDHLRMLRYWLSFWQNNRDILLDGELEPMNPELLYPVVRAYKDSRALIATYYDKLVALKPTAGLPQPTRWILVNGRLQQGLYVEVADSYGPVEIVLKTCSGDVTDTLRLDLQPGIHALAVPAAGTAEISKIFVEANNR